MPIARVRLVCRKCGTEFEHGKMCANKADAENYEAWAVENITLCVNCHLKMLQKKRDAELEKALGGATLPEIHGVSEKQTRYATDLRNRFVRQPSNVKLLSGMAKRIAIVKKAMADPAKAENNRRIAEQAGIPLEEMMLRHITNNGDLSREYAVLTESDAGKLIKALL